MDIEGFTSVTIATKPLFTRGMRISWARAGMETTSLERVTYANGPTLTTRPIHRSRAVEWAHHTVERVILWPLSDTWRWLANVRATVKS